MELPTSGVLIVNGLIAGALVLGVLSVWASKLGHACEVHDLKKDCETLRRHYAERLAAMRAEFDDEPIEVEVVGQVGEEDARRIAA